MTTIYLSSTYEDLKQYRSVVFDALRKSGHQVIAMEDYVAADQRPVDKCLKDIRHANLYIGVFGFRYGYVPPETHGNPDRLSITELEFRAAESLKKPCLTFVVNESKAWPPMFDDARKAEDKGERINRLRQYLLTEKMASSFSEPYELAALVLAAVTKYLEDNKKPQASGLEESQSPALPTWDIGENGSPYPGLMHFTRKYAPVFFGREVETHEILDRMRQPEGRFIIISGGSGTGKSSLVDAGVLPRVEESGIGDGKMYVCARMLPSQGINPFDALLRPLHAYAERAGFNVYELAEKMAAQPDILPEKIREMVSKGLNGNGLVLLLDQMEELFAAQDAKVSNKFLTTLYDAAQQGSLRVLATIRSDHLHHCHTHPEMLRILRSPAGHYPLGPVEPFMLSDMIIKPAKCAGLSVNEGLARRIVQDTGTEPGSLPLLAFVLNQLFEKRSDHELSEAEYNVLGGVTGAIAQQAGSVETSTRHNLGAKVSDLLPKLFQSLVIVKEEGLPTRRRPLLSEFPEEMKKLIALLVEGRLLHTEGEDKNATVSISHEKLFEAWPALRDYISVNKKFFMDQTLLENRARKWIDMGKPWFGGLASGRELRDFRRAGVPTPQAKSYLSASNRAWWMKAVSGLALALVFGFIARAWQQGLSVEYTWLKLKSVLAGIHVEPEMVEVKAGAFQMGDVARRGDKDEQPVHEVKLQKPFKLGKHEVTFDEYDRFALATGKPLLDDQVWGRGRRPVINVSWEDARDFADWLSKQTGKRYRLPSEAEWEYAARSGGKDEVWAGTSDEKQLDNYAVLRKNQTEIVGSRKPNDLGLYDMSGNVLEWIQDCWHLNYNGAPTDGRAWGEENGGNCGQRVMRGGSWGGQPELLRASSRHSGFAVNRTNYIGFRLAQDIP